MPVRSEKFLNSLHRRVNELYFDVVRNNGTPGEETLKELMPRLVEIDAEVRGLSVLKEMEGLLKNIWEEYYQQMKRFASGRQPIMVEKALPKIKHEFKAESEGVVLGQQVKAFGLDNDVSKPLIGEMKTTQPVEITRQPVEMVQQPKLPSVD